MDRERNGIAYLRNTVRAEIALTHDRDMDGPVGRGSCPSSFEV
jgi:hypothetical protein